MNHLVKRFGAQSLCDLIRFKSLDPTNICRTVVDQTNAERFTGSGAKLYSRSHIELAFYFHDAARKQTFSPAQDGRHSAVVKYDCALGFQVKSNPALATGEFFAAGNEKCPMVFAGKQFF